MLKEILYGLVQNDLILCEPTPSNTSGFGEGYVFVLTFLFLRAGWRKAKEKTTTKVIYILSGPIIGISCSKYGKTSIYKLF